MLVYNSMILWIVFLGVCHIRLQHNSGYLVQKKRNGQVPMMLAILAFGYIIFWAGMRTGYVDTAAYIAAFKNSPSEISKIWMYLNSDNKAPGFDILTILFKSLVSTDYHAWLMFIAIISGVPIMLTLRKRSINFFYSAFLFIVTLNFTWMLNGIRQFLVAAILFGLSDWIVERKTLRFVIVVLLLSTIHYTALIMLPAYWLVMGKPFGKKIICFIVALMACVIFLEPFVQMLEGALMGTVYEGYTEQFVLDDGVHPLRVFVMVLPAVIGFLGRKRLESINDKYINLCVNMSLVSAGIYFLGIFTSGILIGRLPIYFELYNLILIPYLVKKCFNKDSSKIMYALYTVGYLLFYFMLSGNLYYISDITGLLS